MKTKKIYVCAISIITILVASIPLFGKGLLAGHDIWYHLLRIENLKIGMENGIFPVKIDAMYLNYYGYAVSLCYPDLFLYFPAILRILGVGIMTSYKCYLLATIIASYATAYYCGKKISGRTDSALITAILYTLCQYHICTLHTRAAVGEIQAFVFVPLVVYGLYNLIYEEFDNPVVMGLGYWGLMMCHSISLAISLCVSVVAVLLNWKRVMCDRKKIIRLLITALVTLLASIAFWLPFLEILASDTFYFSHPWADVTEMALSLQRLLSVRGDIYGFGSAFLLLCGIRILGIKKLRNDGERKKMDCFFLGGVLLLWATTKYFPWAVVKPVLNSIQFPFRIYMMASIFLGVGVGIMLPKICKSKYLVCFVLAIMSLSAFLFYYDDTTEEVILENTYYDESYNSFNVYYKEWLPDTVDIELLRGERRVLNADGTDSAVTTEKSGSITFSPKSGEEYYDVPLIWYKGYEAYTVLEDGSRRELTVEKSDNNGLLRVMADSQMGSQVVVYYKGTLVQDISAWINIVTVVGLLFALGRHQFTYKKKKIEYIN
jgi:hypothetical protein